ncbi:hypothetical protein GN244_ATG02652 [Phytophthora infestans]|uniref:Uncharacterized protein n=1 Tax=Phytophthora infestans TaxID=4787 RepID=A0A833S6F4_PHYIN|nr:hypothetical protein GN244_ATG18660 [Phytophthora infestans]KAF4044947.1 hypothetical protein GN244_ATG02652 [Phytophthora infestans]KAF4138919.1 hypothetical protein GN958_ATG11876 [Phytophthora infestans]
MSATGVASLAIDLPPLCGDEDAFQLQAVQRHSMELGVEVRTECLCASVIGQDKYACRAKFADWTGLDVHIPFHRHPVKSRPVVESSPRFPPRGCGSGPTAVLGSASHSKVPTAVYTSARS